MAQVLRPAPARAGRADALVLCLLCTGQFMVVMDMAVINVALPSVRDQFALSPGALQWVTTAYTLSFAGFLLLGGRLADLWGRRRVFLAGLALFTGAGLAGGLAPGPGPLIAARAAQGLGAALLSPATLTLLTTTFAEGAGRARATGIWSATAAAGGAAGAALGGLLTHALDWRWTLLVNVPLGLGVLAAARRLPADPPSGADRGRLDLLGAVLATAGLMALTAAATELGERGPSDPVPYGFALAAAVLLGSFARHERRVPHTALVPPRALRSRRLSAANALMLLIGATSFSTYYFLQLRLQDDLGLGPLAAGLVFLPFALATAAGARSAARRAGRSSPVRLLTAGALYAVAGRLCLAAAPFGGAVLPDVVLPGVLACYGIGLVTTPATLCGTAGAAAGDAGLASGLLQTSRQVGATLGIAVLGELHSNRGALLGCAATAAAIAVVARTSLPPSGAFDALRDTRCKNHHQ
ncbi:MFS transporter [Streptomyces sp. NPDC096205]|uniref:MFS transporter n=1 Tax=Streptomyces sp. NPDC096205 TaxID=3366081 RepID=UPI0038287E13